MEGESSTYNQSRFECENMSMAVFLQMQIASGRDWLLLMKTQL